MDEDLITAVIAAAEQHGRTNVIVLSGPPATGKSHTAREAAMRIAGHEAFIREVQFHPGFTYEMLMEGFRPNQDGGFAPTAGILKVWSDAADADLNSEQKYVLLIEEFSRADVPAVLGELMTYVEHRDRSVWLPILGEDFSVSDRLVILATMNPRDRSALELDDAVYRRLRVIDCPPRPDLIDDIVPADFEPAARREAVVAAIQHLFAECAAQFAPNYEVNMPFGHAEFSRVHSIDDLRDLWDQQLRYVLDRPGLSPHPYYDVVAAEYQSIIAVASATETVDGPAS